MSKQKKIIRANHFCFFFILCLRSGLVKKLLYETKKKNKNHNKLLYLAKNKLDCIEMLISKSVEDGIIDHNEFTEIINEEKVMTVKKIQWVRVN